MPLQCLAAAAIVLIVMYLALRFVRFAAAVCMILIYLVAIGFSVFSIVTGEWADWPTIVAYSILTGFLAALLSLPVLPFSNLGRRK